MRSPARAMDVPTPRARPFSFTRSGCSIVIMSLMIQRTWRTVSSHSSRSMWANQSMSPVSQKDSPARVRTMTFAESLRTSLKTRASSVCITPFTAFPTSGRFMVMVRISFSFSTRRCSYV